MAPWDDGLVGIHRTIALEPTTPLHVLAGPGTGKTFAMMRRIARLLEEGVPPESILAVSFTRTAAKDLREQLQRLNAPGATSVVASTLHSLCFRLLSQVAVFEQTHRVSRPLMSFEGRQLEADLRDKFGGIRPVRRMLAAYEAAWARLQTEIPGGPSVEIDAAFHAEITAWLRYHRALLIGELIPLTLGFVHNNPVTDAIPQFRHVLADEYQDLNRAEQELVDHLARAGTLTVIGDDCQSIYSFRHANPEGIRTFHIEHTGCVSHSIEQCRRCPPNIVRMSNALISHDPQRSRAIPLLPDRARPDAHVIVVQHRTIDEEVDAIADYIIQYLRTHRDLPPGQVLILTPRRFIGNRIRDAIIARGLNSMSYFAEDPVASDSGAEGFALLNLLIDPSDRPALRAWLGMASQNGRAPAYARVREVAERTGLSPRDVLESLANGRLTLPHTGGLLARWQELTTRLAAIADLRGLELVRAIWPTDNEDCDDIRLMAEMIAVDTEEPAEILEALRHDITQPYLPDSSSEVVRVKSLHKSKGLTAALVVVTGCMAGALPYVDTAASPHEQEAQLREQRRLFYVAITRATDTLILSSSVLLPFAVAMQAQVSIARRRRIGNQQLAETSMSPFVQELGPTCPRPISTQTWRTNDGF